MPTNEQLAQWRAVERFYIEAVKGKKGNLFTRVEWLEENIKSLQVGDITQFITNVIEENKEIIQPSIKGGVSDPTDATFSGIVISPSGQLIGGILYSFAIVVDGVVVSGFGNDNGTPVVVGIGDVVGPASAVDGNIAVFDGVTGKLIADSGISTAGVGGLGDVIGDTVPSVAGNATRYVDTAGKHIEDSGLFIHRDGQSNISIGDSSTRPSTSGSSTVAVGSGALNANAGQGSIAIGTSAGRFETGNYKLFIDYYGASPRATDEASGRLSAIIYGVMNPNPLLQKLYINGSLYINGVAVGDMLKSVYDPQTIEGDAFDTDNHTDGLTNGVYTLTERSKLAGIEAGAEVNNISDVNATDLTDGGATTLHKHDHGGMDGLSDDDHPQYIKHSLATAINDFLVASGAGVFVKKTLAEVVTILRTSLDSIYQAAGTYLTSANIEDSIVDAHTTIAPSGNAVFDALALKEATANKDASGGYAGLTLFKINFKNVANTFISFFTNSNTAARTYTFKDASGTIAFTTDITGTNSGTNTGDQTITLTGDVTGSGTGSFAATIANAAVTLAKMANMATASVFYRKTAGSGAPEVQTLATLKTDLGLTGTNSGDQTISLTGDVTGSGTGSFAATIANDAVTYAKMQNVSATDKVLGRVTAGLGDVEEISTTGSGNVVRATSPTLVTPALGTPSAIVLTNATGTAASLTAGNVTTNANLTGDVTSVGNATTIANGVVTAAKTSITGTPDGTKYLRDDFTWQAVSGGSGLTHPQVMARLSIGF